MPIYQKFQKKRMNGVNESLPKNCKPRVLGGHLEPCTWEAGAGELCVRGQIGIHSVFLASLGYTAEVV